MLEINKKYRLVADVRNVMIEEFKTITDPRTKARGKKWVNLNLNYRSVSSAMAGLLNYESKRIIIDEDVTLKDMLRKLRQLQEDIIEATKHVEVMVVEVQPPTKKIKNSK